jgi:hypothetical protein
LKQIPETMVEFTEANLEELFEWPGNWGYVTSML